MPSKTSLHFVSPADLNKIEGVHVFTDEDEYNMWHNRGDPVLHIEVFFVSSAKVTRSLTMKLRRWADVFVVAPLSANTMAKLAYGLCDTLLVGSIILYLYPQE